MLKGAPSGAPQTAFIFYSIADIIYILGVLRSTFTYKSRNRANAERTSSLYLPSYCIFGTQGYLDIGDPNTFGGGVTLVREETGSCEIPLTHGYDGKPVLPDPSQLDDAYGHRGVGVAEMAWAIRHNRPNRCGKEMALQAQEILCGLDASAESGMKYPIQSSFEKPAPLKAGYLSTFMGGGTRGDAELSLAD